MWNFLHSAGQSCQQSLKTPALGLVAVVVMALNVLTLLRFIPGWRDQTRRKREIVDLDGELATGTDDDERKKQQQRRKWLIQDMVDYDRDSRQTQLQFILFLIVQFAALLVIVQDKDKRWQLVTAILPLLLVLYHAGHLWLEMPNARALESEDDKSKDKDYKSKQRVRGRIIHHYGWETIFARYVVPAILIVIVGLVNFRLLDESELSPKGLSGALGEPFKFGLIGAYFYVFLELGRRSVRHDITAVSIVWCVITLLVGPALATIIPKVFAQGAPSSGDAGLWNQHAVWVFAGYSPRLVFRTLAAGVTKSLRADTSSLQEERQISLGRIQGIGSEEAERLVEEGIRDVHSMACVDPVRLMRDTRFDNWRIISWVDQALLLSVAPEGVWRALIKRGYQGASDTYDLVMETTPKFPRLDALDKGKMRGILEKIAGEAGAEVDVVREMLVRLWEDPRVQDIQSLVNAITDPAAERSAAATPKPTVKPAPSGPGGGGEPSPIAGALAGAPSAAAAIGSPTPRP